MNDELSILKKYWGYDSFRPLQQEIIQSVLDNRDTLALLPTGGGKSICFQVPGLIKEGICVVVSPLIALMKDQVQNLKKRGINAQAIVSGMTYRQVDIALDNCVYGDVKFLYVSPERLKTDLFIERFKKMRVGLIAVDEAHCISQWGYDFRPPYLEISAIRELKPDVKIIALTASATENVAEDIKSKLSFDEQSNSFRKSFLRSNLSYACRYTEDKPNRLLEIVNKLKGSTVVYVRSRKKTVKVAEYLNKKGISATFYHAGLTTEERTKRQVSWISNETRIIVATNAFGMGIDKPDVRLVVHLDIPPDLESYYQEAGRAGRDELPAYAIILYDQNDIISLRDKLDEQHPQVEQLKTVYQAIANHLRIAIGSGYLESYPLDLGLLSEKYQLKHSTTLYALKKLENQGLIELSDATYHRSQVYLELTGPALYQFQLDHPKHDIYIQLLLRLYGGGLYSNFVSVDEKQLARELGTNQSQVRKVLNELAKVGVISYNEQGNIPKITYLIPRMDANKLSINRNILKHQRELAEHKVKSIIQYVESQEQCRSQLILEYFDEKSPQPCGQCDICRKKKPTSKSISDKELQFAIQTLINSRPLTMLELKRELTHVDEDLLKDMVSKMMDANLIRMNEMMKLTK